MGREGERDLLLFLKSITQHPPTGKAVSTDRSGHNSFKETSFIEVMCSTAPPSERLHPQDCAEIYKLGIKDSGIYTIQPDLHRPPLEVITHSHTVTLRPALNVCVCVLSD